MKVALCFIINHELKKEKIWRKWINQNSFLFNVYFFYKKKDLISSKWILNHCLPEKYIFPTSYFHIVQAYFSLMEYAYHHDKQNTWFCFLSESCIPIITPSSFKKLFYENYDKSILKWEKAKWNIYLLKRANLQFLPPEFHLSNSPWFLLERKKVQLCLCYLKYHFSTFRLICKGGIANESIFAIILQKYKSFDNVLNENSTLMDWTRMTSATSPYVFSSKKDMEFIINEKQKNKYNIFLRKIHNDFPDELLDEILFPLTFPTITTIDTSYKCCHRFICRTGLHLVISTLVQMAFSTLECICRCYYIRFIFVFCFLIV